MKTKTPEKRSKGGQSKLRIGVVVPHVFMHREILPKVIFSPGNLALDLCNGLQKLGQDVTLFSPGPVDTTVKNITADLRYFEQELKGRGDSYIDLLKKHPFTFITLARQVQSEIIARAYEMANNDQLDIVHIYTNEEDLALPFAQFCKKPVVFTHHDPFNFMVKYKNVFPKYSHLNWLSVSNAQRGGMPPDTNWIGNIYHGVEESLYKPIYKPKGSYIAYFGRIVEPKGLHLAITAVKKYNLTTQQPITLKIAGMHYAGHSKDTYWKEKIEPEIDTETIQYDGFIKSTADKQEFLGNAQALIIPSVFDEPFGMVMIEALACGTPIVGLDSGAIPEVVVKGKIGFVALKVTKQVRSPKSNKLKREVDEAKTAGNLVDVLQSAIKLDRAACRADFEARFTLDRMCREHLDAYRRLTV